MSLQELSVFAQDRGYPQTSYTPDGKLRRFGKKNVYWYIANSFTLPNGSPIITAVLGDWRREGVRDIFKTNRRYTKQDKDLISSYEKANLDKVQLEKVQQQMKAAKKAKEDWEAADFDDDYETEYFKKKKIKGNFGVKIIKALEGDTILMPLRDIDGNITSHQKILDNSDKYFLTGGKIIGSFHTIGKIDETTAECWIVEGFATGATVHMATNETVIVSTGTNNLPQVTKDVVVKYPDCKFKIAADDDWKTLIRGIPTNPGVIAAQKASAFSRTDAYLPKFKEPRGEKDVDFNDLFVKEGMAPLKAQLVAVVKEKNLYECLGFTDELFHFFREDAKKIINVKNFSEVDMFRLADLDYWETFFPGKNGPNWPEARNHLIQKSTKVGIFDGDLTREFGFWEDDGRFVFNDGRNLSVNGKQINRTVLDSRYIYVNSKLNTGNELAQPLSVLEAKEIIEIAACFNWVKPQSQYLFLGWIAQARISGAMPIRPMIWLTGQKGSGKTTIMSHFAIPLMGHKNGVFQPQGGSTEAGIRRNIGLNSRPIISDEFENEGESSAKRNEQIIQLLRQAFSANGGSIVMASNNSSGTVVYKTNFCALVASINNSLKTAADKSRFTVIDLASDKKAPEVWGAVEKRIAENITEEVGEKLFARAIQQAPNILKSYKILKPILASKVTQRFGDQTGMLLAAYHSLVSDRPITEEEAHIMLFEFDFEEDLQADSEGSDEQELLNILLTSKVTVQDVNLRTKTDSVGRLIFNQEFNRELESQGIKVDLENGYFYVANGNSEIKKILRGTKFYIGYEKTLLRIDGAERSAPRKFKNRFYGKTSTRSTKIPIEFARNVVDY